MKPEARSLLENVPICRATVAQLAAVLPADDAELDAWIVETIRRGDGMALMLLVLTVLSSERPFDARHLAAGAKLIGVPMYLAAFALRAQGDVAGHLLEGIRNTAIHDRCRAAALLTIAVWCDEQGRAYPDQLIADARSVARHENYRDPEIGMCLTELAVRSQDPGLNALIRKPFPKISEDTWNDIVDKGRIAAREFINTVRRPILELIPEAPYEPIPTGGTMRRAVPRTGRNEPCPCGSGKKYKNCCYGKDQERLQHSSDVAGLTQRELRASAEQHLTLERLQRMAGPELVYMDPLEIPRSLLTEYFVRLSLFDLDRAAEYLKKLGYADDLEDSWIFVMWAAVRAGRKDIGERLVELRGPGFTQDELRLSGRLLLAGDDVVKSFGLIEEAARDALKTDAPEGLLDLAYAVASKFSGLGILMYRAVLPLIPAERTRQMYDELLRLRDALNLSSEDPIHKVLEATMGFDAEDADAALREAEEKFEAKRREVRTLRESLDQLQKELARRERPAASMESQPAITAVPESEEKLRELRQKVKHLEADLKERHEQRNALQRRLEVVQAKVEALHEERAQLAATAGDKDADQEEDLLLQQTAEESHPLRLIEFPRNFHERLNEFPHHVARGAMIMLGRLAGGDSAAFSGAKRLKSRPNVVRQRIGIDFRLLFRLLPDRIQVIDLIPRQDLERRIKTLT
jgi:hypothetical protein